MRVSFSRGTLIQAAGAKPIASSSAALYFSLDDIPSGRDLFQIEDETFGAIYLAKTPWWSELPAVPSERGLWLSYQGFSSGIWHDGIFGRFEEGRWTDLVLPGPAFTLEFGRSRLALDEVDEFWQDEKHHARKQSLLLAVQNLFPGGFPEETLINPGESKTDFVLALLLLRLAFPEALFHIEPEDVRWKRLAQNLNIEPRKDPFHGPRIQAPEGLGPKEKSLELLLWQQRKSPFIPLNLLASLVD